MAAAYDLVDDNPVAFFYAGDAGAGFFDDADDLMADDPGVGGGGVGPVVDADVGTADPSGRHADQYVVVFGDGGLFHVDDAKLFGTYDLYCFRSIPPYG